MATQKPISSISYNTEEFLKEKLNTWIDNHLIQNYMYIVHKGEDGDKDHIHFRIEPNKKLDPMDLKNELKEYQIGKDKPLGIRPWRPSKEEDWILYAVHDPDYMKLKYAKDKGEKLPYKWEQIVCPEDYDMEIAFLRAKQHLENTTPNITYQLQNGVSPTKLLLEGQNPYIVKSIVSTLSSNDYLRLADEYKTLNDKHEALIQAVFDKGFSIDCDEDGNIVLNEVKATGKAI